MCDVLRPSATEQQRLEMDSEAKDVGILAIELIFPSQYVDQAEMEQYDQVSKGKYTVGLGQQQMGFCTDKEDVYSLCLTVVSKLMERNNIPYSRIGCLQVGTETILDKSKSVKSVLMQLFEESGNKDVEGIDNVNACYGGTAALFNAVAWIESSAWDGRYALAVAGDIAVYAKGNARPTGGAGAVAMLLGPNAPLILDKGVRATYMEHAYDFYKPKLSSEYPLVDGRLSIKCYLNALDNCYKLFCQKNEQLCHNGTSGKQFNLTNLDAVIFHSPYCKLVQKSLARLVLNDFLRMPKEKQAIKYPELKPFQKRKLEDTYFDRDVEKILLDVSKDVFMEKTEPALLFAKRVGNMYTPSLYAGLVSLLISKSLQELSGKRVCLFSYGSGLASTMYSLHIASDIHPGSALYKLVNNLVHLRTLLDVRQKIHPKEFDQIMQIREMNHHKAPYTPLSSADNLFPGTWYLESIDSLYRRSYKQVP